MRTSIWFNYLCALYNFVMFLNFKKKPTLASLIPNSYCDIHSHILPGIDDGAPDSTKSHTLMTEVQKLGFAKVIATPHTFPGLWNNTPETIMNAYGILQAEQPALCKALQLDYASEYLLTQHIIAPAEQDQLLCLKDRYLLVEMSYLNPPLGLFEIIFELKQHHYIPVLAHPERYLFYYNSFNMYEKLKEAGCYFQLNLLSSVDYYGASVTELSQKLLSAGMIDFVGSDIHKMRHVQAFQQKIKVKAQTALEEAIARNKVFI